MNYKIVYSNELYHFGIKGMKWGVRRYQNKDGSLTDLGKKRYKYGQYTISKSKYKDIDSHIITNKKGKKLEISTRSLRNLEKSVEEDIIKELSYGLKKDHNLNWSTKKVRKWLNSGEAEPVINQVNDLIDKNMSKKIDSLFTEVSSLPQKEQDQIWRNSKSQKQTKESTQKQTKKSTQKQTKQLTQEQALSNAYTYLKKKYPNFNTYPQEKQDKLFIDYVNSSGLYKYI